MPRPILSKIRHRLIEGDPEDDLLERENAEDDLLGDTYDPNSWGSTLQAADSELRQLSSSLAKLRDIGDSFNLMTHGEYSLLNQMAKLQSEITTLNLENIQMCAQQLQAQAACQMRPSSNGIQELELQGKCSTADTSLPEIRSGDSCNSVFPELLVPTPSSVPTMPVNEVDLPEAKRSLTRDSLMEHSRVTSKQIGFIVCKAWTNPLGSFSLRLDSVKASMTGSGLRSVKLQAARAGAKPGSQGKRTGMISRLLQSEIALHPAGKRRLTWDLLTIFMLTWDLVMIPFCVTFNINRNIVIDTLNWVTISFWTLDIPIAFFTGYYSREDVERKIFKTSWHYMKTWFLFDVAILGVDWGVTISTFDEDEPGSQGDGVSVVVYFRRLRLLRIFRLLRLLKLQAVLHDIGQLVRSESLLIFGNIGKSFFMIILASHLFACAWYKIGSWNDTWKDTWLIVDGMSGRSLAYRYSTSLHWALTQFTPASMEVVPANAYERFFTIGVILFAVVAFSFLVSSITNAGKKLADLNRTKVAQNYQLRRFLNEKQIPGRLSSSIWGFLEEVRDTKSTSCVHWDEVAVLALLPRSLQGELQQQAFMPILGLHPFFNYLNLESQMVVGKLFEVALGEMHVSTGQEVFQAGERAQQMYWTVRGQLSYISDASMAEMLSSSHPLIQSAEKVVEGQCFCEPPLWIEWRHAGKMSVETAAELICIKAPSFQDTMREDGIGCFLQASKYAVLYAKLVNEADPSEITDIWSDSEAILSNVLEAFRQPASDVIATSTSQSQAEFSGRRITSNRSRFRESVNIFTNGLSRLTRMSHFPNIGRISNFSSRTWKSSYIVRKSTDSSRSSLPGVS